MEPTRRDVMIGAAAAVLSTQPVLGAVERPRPPVDPVDLNHWLRQVSTARQRIETADRRAVRSVLMAGDESGAERSLEVAAFVNEASWVANVLTAFAMLPPEQRN